MKKLLLPIFVLSALSLQVNAGSFGESFGGAAAANVATDLLTGQLGGRRSKTVIVEKAAPATSEVERMEAAARKIENAARRIEDAADQAERAARRAERAARRAERNLYE